RRRDEAPGGRGARPRTAVRAARTRRAPPRRDRRHRPRADGCAEYRAGARTPRPARLRPARTRSREGKGGRSRPPRAAGRELAALHEEVEEARVRLEPHVLDPRDRGFERAPALPRPEDVGRALERGVADLEDPVGGEIGHETDAARRGDIEV